MELRGHRVVLRPAISDDAAAMSRYLSDPDVAHYLTHPPLGLEAIQARLRTNDAFVDDRFNLLFAVVLGQEVIGEVHAWNIGEQHQPASSDPSEVWIGYALDPRFEGKGFAFEAVALVLDWLDARGATTVFANLYADNNRSQQLLERLGFVETLSVPPEQDGTGRQRPSLRMALDLARR